MKKLMYAAPLVLTLALAGCSGSDSTTDEEKKATAANTESKNTKSFTYDDKDLEAEENGAFDVALSLKEDYEIKKVEGAETQDWGDGEVDLTGTIDRTQKEQEIKLIISNGKETERDSIVVKNTNSYNAYQDYLKEKKNAKSDMKEARKNSQKISYKQLEKSLDGYTDTPYYLKKAYVVQAIESGGNTLLLVSTDENGIYYEKVFAIWLKEMTEAVKGDFVEVYGKVTEHYNYELKAGGTNNVPAIMATKVNVIK